MNDLQCLCHSKWECKYHVVLMSKTVGRCFTIISVKDWAIFSMNFACQKENKVLEGHLQTEHVHMLISIVPKYAVAQIVIGYMKSKSATHIVRTYLAQKKNYVSMHF